MRCGFVLSANRLQFQFQFNGSAVPQNTRLIVCNRCLDDLDEQQGMIIIPPDPPAMMNTNPESYTVDSTDWLVTQDGDILVTEDDTYYIADAPNPDADANTSVLSLTANIQALDTLTVAYLDLFDGDPTDGGVSILSTINGSATRTNVFSSLTLNDDDIYVNSDYLVVCTGALAVANVSHVAIYSAATDGTLLASGPLGATYPLIAESTVVQFDQLGLEIISV